MIGKIIRQKLIFGKSSPNTNEAETMRKLEQYTNYKLLFFLSAFV